MAKRSKRFPRLEIDRKSRIAEKILRLTFNKMKLSRDLGLRTYGKFDIYRTKAGWKAKLAFIFLAEKLVQRNIDPALYIKVMCRYGKYKQAKWMPHPSWLMKDKTIEKFLWVYRRERKSYELHTDWKKDLDGWSDLDIYSDIRSSGTMVKQASDGTGLSRDESMRSLWDELSPWFVATHVLKSKESNWKDFRKCLRFLGKHPHVRYIAEKAMKRSFL